MATTTNVQLVEVFRRFLADKWGYVYGAQGQMWSEELAQKWQAAGRSVPNGRNKATYFVDDCKQWIGHYVTDCSGGIVQAIRQHAPNYGDRTANTFKSQFSESGAINNIPEIPGLAVWRTSHIGVYVGGGKVIEFRGTDYGCVETELAKRNFTHWGRLRDITYPGDTITPPETEESAQPIPTPTPAPASATPKPEPRLLKLADPMMRGDDVLALQKALEARGFGLGKVDGIFGAKTEAAVKAFKARYLLDIDGSVGTQTRKELRI